MAKKATSKEIDNQIKLLTKERKGYETEQKLLDRALVRVETRRLKVVRKIQKLEDKVTLKD